MIIFLNVSKPGAIMTDEEFTTRMQEIANGVFQPGVQHGEADDLIIEYLKSRGLDDAVAAYESIHRLYG